MGLIRRCSVCRKEGGRYSSQGLGCNHKEAIWAIKFLVGGKQIFKTLGRNKREAERHLMQIKSDLSSGGSYQETKNILFKELAEKWFKNHEQSANPKPGTISTYEARLRLHILPILGQKVVSQITPYDIENAKQEIRTKLGARYTNAVLITIGTILKYGWSLGFCKSNPAQLIKKLGVTGSVGTTISREEAVALLRNTSEPYRTIFFAMLCTGTRVGEITGLQWKDIDFKNDLITIERNVIHGPKGKFGMGDKSWVFGTPKSKNSTRRVSMIPALKVAFLRHSEKGASNPHGLVFCTKADKPYDRSMLGAKLRAAAKAASIKPIRIHDLRHTNASWLLAGDVNLAAVSKHLGHSGVAITGDIYHHLLPKDYERSMKLLDGVFPVWESAQAPQLPSTPR